MNVLPMLLVLVAVLARVPLERSMMLHMLVQLPLLFVAGVLMARTGAGGARVHPIAAFVFATGVWTAWMIPRALDAAVEQPGVDALKAGSLVLAGLLASQAWHRSSAVVRTFVAGNSAWMMATIGVLYLDTPARLCTSYGRGEQQQTGIALVALTVLAVVLGWWRLTRTAPAPLGPRDISR